MDAWAELGPPRKLDSDDTKDSKELKAEAKLVQFEGWVEKQSRYFRSWRHRWLVLQYPYLFTFKRRRQYDSPTEIIDLRECSIVASPSWINDLGPFGFELSTPNATFAIRTQNQYKKIEWVTTIVRAKATPGAIEPLQSRDNGSNDLKDAADLGSNQNTSSPINDDVEEALMRQVMRESAIEAGLSPNLVSNEPISESTALRIQQDVEYQHTLEEDMRREQMEKQHQSEVDQPINAGHPKRSKSEYSQNLPDAKVKLPPEPVAGPNTCTCQVRLPSGSKVVRRFLMSDTLKIVKFFVRYIHLAYVAPVLHFSLSFLSLSLFSLSLSLSLTSLPLSPPLSSTSILLLLQSLPLLLFSLCS